jgi:FKBP-type peptidyl-prolyl cis-trans isomerase
MNSSTELKITDTQVGTGREAVKGAKVTVHYEGFLDDGRKFDSSKDRGRAFSFVLGTGKVIKGWDQGLMGMKEGGLRTLHIPAELAYGARSVGIIPPNSNLTFHIELIESLARE